MAKKNKTNKTATVKKNIPAPAPVVEEPVVESPVVVEEETKPTKTVADITLGEIATGSAKDGLDANHRVELNGQIIDMFVKNPDARSKFGDQIVDSMTEIAYIGVVSAVADEAVNGNSTFAITIRKGAYAGLLQAASTMGITLPPLTKTLPGVGEYTVKVNSTQIKVSAETKKQLKAEKKIEDAGDADKIELDPVKVAALDDEALTKALTYILVTGPKRNKSVKDSLVAAADFMQAYRTEKARSAKDSTTAMNAIADRSMYEILSDCFTYVKPTTFIKGIGIGMHTLVSQEKTPLSAFLILRGALIDKETKKPVWDDQSIADTVRALVEFICKDRIESAKEEKAKLDSKAKDYKEKSKAWDLVIKNETAMMSLMTDFDFSIADNYSENTEDTVAQKAYGRILRQYYPECDHRGSNYEGLNENIRQQVGIILNLFRAPGNKNTEYDEAYLSEVKEVTLDDAAKKLKAKEALEAKKAESKKKDLPISKLRELVVECSGEFASL